MDDCADLEIKLHLAAPKTYSIEMRSAVPGSETVSFLGLREGCIATIDADDLAAADNAEAYGHALTDALFAHERVRVEFAEARSEAEATGCPLRLRLVMDGADLHNVRWELLLDPDDRNSRLALSSRVRLSRYPVSEDRERIGLRRPSDLKALVAVANRPEIGAVDVRGEVQRITQALGAIESDCLPAERDGIYARADLSTIRQRLRDGRHDILYLVAHGGIRNGEARLWLDVERGGRPTPDESVRAADLADVIRQLEVRPRLIVLASCESAGTESGDAALAIGPALASAGIPAVIAMQGEIQVATLQHFMTVFFEQLVEDGVIDRAVVEARHAVRTQTDWWSPVLFMRLASGRIWSTGFGVGSEAASDWRNLAANIERPGKCTAVLGPGLMEPILGSREELARSLALDYQYPLGPGDRSRLYRVEQYIETRFRPDQLDNARLDALRAHLLEQHAAAIPERLREERYWDDDDLRTAIGAATDAHLEASPDGPYRRLARLKLRIYVETSVHDGMERALRLEGADPVVRMCPWYAPRLDPEIHLFDDAPSSDQPLVYHLFGRHGVPQSVAIGEDGLYDYLLGLGRHLDAVPDCVQAALVSTSLLLLGFRLEDPEFRTMFRYIFTREGHDLKEFSRRSHAAVQLEPSDDVVTDVGLALDYYERYFTDKGLMTYWGTAAEFMAETAEWIERSE